MLLLYTLVLFTLQFTLMPLSKGNLIDVTAIAKPGCLSKCGEVTVPYPFGINTIAMANGSVTEHDCSLEATFELTCNFTSKSPELFFGSLKVISISLSDSEMRTSITIAFRCYDSYANVTASHTSWTNIPEWYPFTFSEKNKLTVIGCDDYAWIRGPDGSDYASGCMGLCNNPSDVPNNGTCSGIGCCQTSIPPGLKYFNISLGSFDNHKNVVKSNRCGFAFLGDEKSFQFGGARDMSDANEFFNKTRSTVHRVLDWVIGMNQSCSEATVCKGNSVCRDADIGGYHCVCKEGYAGNPYLDLGCQDIDECKDNNTFPCYGNCTNTPGSYNCTCPPGYDGDVKKENGCQPIREDSESTDKDSNFQIVEYTLVPVFGLLAILFVITGIYFFIRKRKLIKLREMFFEQNGGVFLKQKLRAPGATDVVTMFSTEQLRKATDNYSKERIVGQGGYGVVYKGIFPDKRVVAIKKSKVVDATQSEQFINEIWILTQVIHRNVVKVLGCCLEEEVPVLVYEFISNNTLFYHLHHKPGGMSWLSWENRLRIAAETASALAYLHSQATMPITQRCESMKENRLFQIVDSRVLREGSLEQLQAVAELVKRCLNVLGEDRPTMKEVAMELEGLRKFTAHPWVPQQTPEESRSLILKVEESDLYGVPLIPYSSNEWESYSGTTTEMPFQENKPR
ncbi:hypothetical protein LXL04_036108 [Taraxacum kok-saghyz]